MKPVEDKKFKTVTLTVTQASEIQKQPELKAAAENLIVLLCDMCEALAAGRNMKFSIGRNAKTNQLYAVMNEGAAANWANGSCFGELLKDIKEAL